MIDLALSPEQSELKKSVRAVVSKEFPLSLAVGAAIHGPPAFDWARWARLADLGWFGVSLGEVYGGAGFGTAEEFLMMCEFGKGAADGPLLATLLAIGIAASAGDHVLAGRFASGKETAGLVVGPYVVDGADGGLAVRMRDDGADLVRVSGLIPSMSVDPLSKVGLAGGLTSVLTVSDPTQPSRLRLLVGAYLVGLAEAAVDMAVEYAKIREQFGKPIGSFQAIKHYCADMVIRYYPARVQLAVGAIKLQHGVEDSGRQAIAAGLLLAGEAARQNTQVSIQIHGAVGFTSEAPAGVLLTRGRIYRHLAGSMSSLRRELVTGSGVAQSLVVDSDDVRARRDLHWPT